jgi:hypothetical protein
VTDHRCRRDERCTEAEKIEQRPAVCDECACHDGPFRPCTVSGGCGHLHKPVPTKVGGRIHAEDGLCPTCTRVSTHAIAKLPRDYVDLTEALQHGTVGMGELVAATKDLPAPLRVSVAALCEEIVTQAVVWGELVADRVGVTWDTDKVDRHTRPGWRLQRATRLLSQSVSVLLALQPTPVREWSDNGWYSTLERDTDPDGISGALTLLRLHHIARAVVGQTKLVHELPAPCPNCDRLALARDDGADHVHCRHCRLQWEETEYSRLTLVVAAEYVGTEQIRPPRPRRPRSSTEGTVGRPVPVG